MNILLTGINSFTGIMLARELLKKGNKVIALSSGNLNRLNSTQKKEILDLYENKSFFLILGNYEIDNKFIFKNFKEDIHAFIIHGFKAFDYKNLELNSFSLAKDSLFWLEALPAILKERSCKLVAYTGTYFENFSPELQTPYSIAKSMGWLYLKKLFCEFRLLKYLLPNPYGPLESHKFTASILKKWINKEVLELQYPYLVRDNIPAEFLIHNYVKNILLMAKTSSKNIKEYSPSYIVESNLELALRLSNYLNKFGFECKMNLSENNLSNVVSGIHSIRGEYIHLENDFFEDYIKKAIISYNKT